VLLVVSKEQFRQYQSHFQHKRANIHEYIGHSIVLMVQLHHSNKHVSIFPNIRERNSMRISQEYEHLFAEFDNQFLQILGSKHMCHCCTNQHFHNHLDKSLSCSQLLRNLARTNKFHSSKFHLNCSLKCKMGQNNQVQRIKECKCKYHFGSSHFHCNHWGKVSRNNQSLSILVSKHKCC